MRKRYTENDLVAYLYGEMSLEEQIALEKHLKDNGELKNHLEELKKAQGLLNKGVFSPSPSSVKIILEHDKRGEQHLEPSL